MEADFLTSGIPIKYRRMDVVVYANNTVLYQGRELSDPGIAWFQEHGIPRERKTDTRSTIDGHPALIFATGETHGYCWSEQRKKEAVNRLRRKAAKA